jgi:hypothetical protein
MPTSPTPSGTFVATFVATFIDPPISALSFQNFSFFPSL